MNSLRFVGIVALLALAGCSGRFQTAFEEPVGLDVTRNWAITDVRADVPDTLSTTESNTLAPNADIVWHGELEGDRRAQVAAILREGAQKGASGLSGPQRVTLAITLLHFHAVTPRAVSSAPAAVHNIAFAIQAFDTKTGEALTDLQTIEADFEAHVGSAALVAAQQGETQRVRIVDHIGRVVAGWLGSGADPRRSFVSIGR